MDSLHICFIQYAHKYAVIFAILGILVNAQLVALKSIVRLQLIEKYLSQVMTVVVFPRSTEPAAVEVLIKY